MKKTTLAALASGALLSAAGGAYHAGARMLADEAMKRVSPQTDAKSSPLPGGPSETGTEWAVLATQELRALPLERVELKGGGGTLLVGHWRDCEGAKRVIVAMHGWHSAWYRDFGASADFWHENGCAVLYAEQRGQGESGGTTSASACWSASTAFAGRAGPWSGRAESCRSTSRASPWGPPQ